MVGGFEECYGNELIEDRNEEMINSTSCVCSD